MAGDIGGTPDDPLVVGIQGTPVSPNVPLTNQLLEFDGSNWAPSTITKGIHPPVGDIGGTVTAPIVAGLQTIPLSGTAPTTNQLLRYDGTSWAPSTVTTGTGVSIAQDLGGTDSLPLVVGIQGYPVSNATPSTGDVLEWNGSIYVPTTAGGSGGGSTIWRKFTIGHATSGLATGAFLYTSTTDDLILDFYPLTTVAFNGLTPLFDLITGGTTGILASRGASPIPMWVQAVQPGGNTGLLVSGPSAGPRAAMSYVSAMTTLAWSDGPPAIAEPIFVAAGGTVEVAVSQDGTTQTAAPASVTATAAPSSLTVTSSANEFIWTGTDPVLGGAGRLPETFTVTPSAYGSIGALVTAINGAAGTMSDTFSQYATVSQSGGVLTVTDIGGGAAGNNNLFGPATLHDITAQLNFDPPGLLSGGQGAAPGASAGTATVLVLTATPQ